MPYSKTADLPDSVKNALPAAAQRIWMAAYNNADGDEEKKIRIAWGAVKNAGYAKGDDGKWVKSETAKNALETVSIAGVEILSPGRWNGREFTSADLDNMVSAFQATNLAYKPFGKLGHNEDQELLAVDGLPAAGWVSNLYRSGKKLVADFTDVPAKLADLIKANAYRTRSAEVWFNRTIEGTVYPAVLKAVAWLGADAPAVTSLDDIAAMFTNDDAAPDAVATLTSNFPHDAVRSALYDALEKVYPLPQYSMETGQTIGDTEGPCSLIHDVFDDVVIVRNADYDKFFSIPYSMDDSGNVTLGEATPVRVSYVPLADESDSQSTAPVKNSATSDPPVAVSAPPAQKGTETMEDSKLRTLLGIAEEADIEQALIGLKAGTVALSDHQALTEEVKALRAREDEREADALVDSAIRAGKVTPKLREWAKTYCLSNKDGFATYVESAPKVVNLSELGTASDTPETLTADEAKIAKAVGVDPAKVAELKAQRNA